MKKNFLLMLGAGLALCACGGPLADSRYAVALPELPDGWEAVLGSPMWRLEWLNGEGRMEILTVQGAGAAIDLPQTWASAVTALPYWPERGLPPGIFKPAGAIFPFDASGRRLILSWQGGVDANLYREFVRLAAGAGEEAPAPDRAAAPRQPWYFDWPRFRRLFSDPAVSEEIRADPWRADWGAIAEKTVQSGFDKRRLVPAPRGSLAIPADGGISRGPWIGSSPFAPPLLFEPGAALVFPVRAAADTWVSREWTLRCNTEAWMLIDH